MKDLVSKNYKDLILNYKTLIFIFLCVIYVFISYWPTTSTYLNGHRSWLQADWLINYQDGGFKRRGLSGSIIFLIQDLTSLSLSGIVYSIQLILYATFFIIFVLIIYKKKIDYTFFLLTISPLSFTYLIMLPAIIGRKEIMFLSLFCFFVFLISNKKLNFFKEISVVCCLVICILFHEVTLFYVPYFLLTIFWFSDFQHNFKRYALYLIPSALTALIILFFGKKINEGSSKAILESRGFYLQNERGVFDWNVDVLNYLYDNGDGINHFFIYLFILLLVMSGLYYYLKRNFLDKGTLIFKYFILIVLGTIPLFILAIDWGRWIFIHFISMVILISSKLPASHKYNSSSIIKSPYIMTGLLSIIFLIFTINHCFGVDNMYGFKDVSLTWPIIKIIELL